MAVDRAIGDLPAAEQVADNDLLVLEQGGEAKKVSGKTYSDYLARRSGLKDYMERAEEAIDKGPYIGDNGNWYVWDGAAGAFADTGRPSALPGPEGPQGPTGPAGAQGPAGEGVPSGGTIDQVLTRTANGTAWKDLPESNGVSDWNQNDPAIAGYIKNRTHWTEPREAVLTERTISKGTLMNLSSAIGLVLGEQYVVTYNGTEYICVAQNCNNNGVAGIGLGQGYGMSGVDVDGNAVGFSVLDFQSDDSWVIYVDMIEATFSIDKAETVHKLDKKFLPDGAVVPPFTEADNGKTLGVVNGALAWVSK